MPFCASSFSQLIKEQGFLMILPPSASQIRASLSLCAGFVLFVTVLKQLDLLTAKATVAGQGMD